MWNMAGVIHYKDYVPHTLKKFVTIDVSGKLINGANPSILV